MKKTHKSFTEEEKNSHAWILFALGNVMYDRLPFKVEQKHKDYMIKEFKKICTQARKLK